MYLHNDDNYKLDFDEENGTLLPSMIYLGIYLNFFLMIFLDEISWWFGQEWAKRDRYQVFWHTLYSAPVYSMHYYVNQNHSIQGLDCSYGCHNRIMMNAISFITKLTFSSQNWNFHHKIKIFITKLKFSSQNWNFHHKIEIFITKWKFSSQNGNFHHKLKLDNIFTYRISSNKHPSPNICPSWLFAPKTLIVTP